RFNWHLYDHATRPLERLCNQCRGRANVLDHMRQDREIKFLAPKRLVECSNFNGLEPGQVGDLAREFTAKLAREVRLTEALSIERREDRTRAGTDLHYGLDIGRRHLQD